MERGIVSREEKVWGNTLGLWLVKLNVGIQDFEMLRNDDTFSRNHPSNFEFFIFS